MASSSFRPSTRRTVIDLTDSDDGGAENNDNQSYIKQIARLKAQVTGLQTEVLDLKAGLEHSQVDLKYTKEKLKQAINANSAQHSEPTGSRVGTISKRPRSPSIDSVDPQAWKKRKGKSREEIVVKPPVSPGKPKLEMYVSVPRIESIASRFKIEKESPKKATIAHLGSPSAGSNSLRQSDDRPEAEEFRHHLVALGPSFDSQIDSNDTPSTPSGITSPDIPDNQIHRDQMVTSTTKPRVAQVTQKVHKSNDSPIQVAKKDLQSTTSLVISPPPLIVPVSRALLQRRYDGSSQALIQKIKGRHNPSSASSGRNIIFPDFEHNPDLPLKPGAPGFLYAFREDVQAHSFSLFIRCTGSKTRIWKYLGEYQTERTAMMSKQFFYSLPDKVQSTWTDKLKAKSVPQERLAIVKLTCTSYDHVFAEDIRQIVKTWSKTGLIKAVPRFVHHQGTVTTTTARTKASASSGYGVATKNGVATKIGVATKRRVEGFNQSTAGASNDGLELEDSISNRHLRPRKSASYVLSDADYELEGDDDEELGSDLSSG